jgi:hypothetical protein
MRILTKIGFVAFLIISFNIIFQFSPVNYVFADISQLIDPLAGRFSDYSLGGIIKELLPFIFGLAAMISLLFLIWGGIRYMMARGDPKTLDAAKATITSAIIGLLIIIFSVAISFFIGNVFKINIFTSIPLVKPVFAQEVDIGCTLRLVGNVCISGAFPTVGSFFTSVVRAVLAFTALLFLFMVVWGGFNFLNAGGDPKATDAARSTITNAVIGLLIVLASFAIIEIITRISAFSIF